MSAAATPQPYRMDDVSEERLALIMPALADKVRQLAQILEGKGIVIRVVQGLRSWAEQDALYAQGRTAPGKKVTNCPGGCSYHNFGMAVDVVPSLNEETAPFNPDWTPSHPDWQAMIQAGTSLGLDSGALWRTFKDFPHFQLTGRFPEGEPNGELKQIFKDAGMVAVWRESGVA